MANTKLSNMRLDQETESSINALKRALGGTKTSIVKQAVKELARKEGIERFVYNEEFDYYHRYYADKNYAIQITGERWKQEREAQIVKLVERGVALEDARKSVEVNLHNVFWSGEGVEVIQGMAKSDLPPVLNFHDVDE